MPVKRTTFKDGRQDAIALLKEDHRKVKNLLKKLENTRDPDTRRNIFDQIDSDLQTHTKIEEEIFYPAFKNSSSSARDQKLYFEALQEHHVVDIVLPEMRSSSLASEVFAAKAKVLKDIVEHHIDEEESEMLPKARKLLGSQRLRTLGAEMQHRRDQLQTGMWDRALEVLNPFVHRTTPATPKRGAKTAAKRRAA